MPPQEGTTFRAKVGESDPKKHFLNAVAKAAA